MFSLVVKQLFGNPCFGPWVSVETNNKILFVVLAHLSRSDFRLQTPTRWLMPLKGCSYPGVLHLDVHIFHARGGGFCLVSPCLALNFVTEGLLSCLYCSDIPMAQFIINLNASLPASQKFIIHVLDSTHMFVQPHVSDMIRSAISDFREQNSYEKPS
ncbi:hypothetical protein POTOM_004491 [Populus tomentosa]|uniref:General transcription and DNA repair factor IIH subunit TFB5 n=1 Tax=Populus tomentosa TaxID=118781 RepID=A0A8X8AVH5_POPTO|nr:hypothetical protein POTOM_004491 [Populus tomentosa]